MQRAPLRFLLPALLLACGVVAVSFAYGTKTAGGSDSFGYLSQADYWAQGRLPFMDLSYARGTPLQSPPQLFSPLAWESDRHWNLYRAVPITAPGYPLLVAAAKRIGGDANKFWIVPLFAGVMVLATFGIGWRMASPGTGLIAALLTATSPTVLYMSMAPMSDVPAAGAWAAAIFFLLGKSHTSAAAAGLFSGLAIMIRPNHLPLAAVLGLFYVAELTRAGVAGRRGALIRGALYAAGALVGIIATAWINDALYRSPWRSGYGDLGRLFSPAYVWPNLQNYFGWIVESQTPLVLAGFAALLVPIRAWWPALENRAAVLVGALFVATLWSIYLFYEVFDAWWYLRFVLGSWPFLMVGTAAVIAWIMRKGGRAVGIVAGVLLAGLSWQELAYAERRQAFIMWHGERRSIAIGEMVAKLTEPNSVILTGQHSGAIRYYGGRVTMRVDRTAGDEADAMTSWAKSRGLQLYLAIEDWEREYTEFRWRGSQSAATMKTPPRAVYRQGNDVLLFALTEPRAADEQPEIFTGVETGMTMRGPAPAPFLFAGPPGTGPAARARTP